MLHPVLTHIRTRIATRRATRLATSARYRERFDDIPRALFPYWAERANDEFKGIPRDALFYAHATAALLDFFDCVAHSERPCALPSKAADSVWHAWLRHSPITLQRFCLKHHGRLIPHLEAADMPAPMGDALANCLAMARRLAGLPAGGDRLPPLFATDRLLRMPHGFGYRSAGGMVALFDLNGLGRPSGDESFPATLQAASLLAGGLVYDWEVPHLRPRGDGSGGACGAGSTCASSSDGAGCDGGGGSSCGSSCGGGCGGGCGGS